MRARRWRSEVANYGGATRGAVELIGVIKMWKDDDFLSRGFNPTRGRLRSGPAGNDRLPAGAPDSDSAEYHARDALDLHGSYLAAIVGGGGTHAGAGGQFACAGARPFVGMPASPWLFLQT